MPFNNPILTEPVALLAEVELRTNENAALPNVLASEADGNLLERFPPSASKSNS